MNNSCTHDAACMPNEAVVKILLGSDELFTVGVPGGLEGSDPDWGTCYQMPFVASAFYSCKHGEIIEENDPATSRQISIILSTKNQTIKPAETQKNKHESSKYAKYSNPSIYSSVLFSHPSKTMPKTAEKQTTQPHLPSLYSINYFDTIHLHQNSLQPFRRPSSPSSFSSQPFGRA